MIKKLSFRKKLRVIWLAMRDPEAFKFCLDYTINHGIKETSNATPVCK